MSNMPKAPLIYTLGLIRFPPNPAVLQVRDELIGAFRRAYPQFDEIALNFIRANITVGPEANPKIDSRELKMFQFSSPDRTWASFVSETGFGIHTSRYVDHEDFFNRLRESLEMLLTVKGTSPEWVEAVGLRYVDLVRSRPGESLNDFLMPWVLPPLPDFGDEMKITQGLYVAAYATTQGELRLQSLRNPPMTLPPDLNTPLVQKNGWAPDVPTEDFALMDIDHGQRFRPLKKFDIDEICSIFPRLRTSSRAIFDHAGTEHALRVWNGEI
jgi:uncharacterized protein (TIGR04255 family)